jgi:hypothetical protein
MKHVAHFICMVFGAGAIFVGIIGLLRAQWENGVGTLCLGAALFLLALIDDKRHDLGEMRDKLDLLVEKAVKASSKP